MCASSSPASRCSAAVSPCGGVDPASCCSAWSPALVVAVLFAVLVVAARLNIRSGDGVPDPFADGWDPELARLFRLLAALALIIGVVTLRPSATRPSPCWSAIRSTRASGARSSASTANCPAGDEPGFWRGWPTPPAVLASGRSRLLLTVVGFIPVVGPCLRGARRAGLLGGRIVALELTSPARGARPDRRAERRRGAAHPNARVVGFGVAVNLCMLVPGGAVLVMPAAVAGATELARHAFETSAA